VGQKPQTVSDTHSNNEYSNTKEYKTPCNPPSGDETVGDKKVGFVPQVPTPEEVPVTFDGPTPNLETTDSPDQPVPKPAIPPIPEPASDSGELDLGPQFAPVNNSQVNQKGQSESGRSKDTPEEDRASTVHPEKITDIKGAVKSLWELTPPRGRFRSSHLKVEKAIKLNIKTVDDLETAKTALKAYCLSKDWTKEGGEFVPGLHTWIRDGKWRNVDIGPATTPRPGETAKMSQFRGFKNIIITGKEQQ
jgi:hypothetical protein